MQLLLRSFYNRRTPTVARELLGKILCRRWRGKILRSRITEVEAYVGPEDEASHASRGKTKRNAPMFGSPGHAYIYLIYGMYWCLNIVTERRGYPAAVLIRGVDTVSGPGRLCRAFAITGTLNNTDITKRGQLWIEDAPLVSRSKILATPRIGVDYAGAWKHKLWRFLIKNPQSRVWKSR